MILEGNVFHHHFYLIEVNILVQNSRLVPSFQTCIFGRVHFLLRSISNLKSISDLRQRNLLRSFSNVKRGTFLNLPHQITFSKPSQYIQGGPSQSEYLLSSFSNLPHQITFSKPSQHIQGGPSQSEYLLSSFSNGVHVLHQFL